MKWAQGWYMRQSPTIKEGIWGGTFPDGTLQIHGWGGGGKKLHCGTFTRGKLQFSSGGHVHHYEVLVAV